MPISGVVITTRPEDLHQTRQFLATCAGVEVHGADGRGNIVAVFDTRTSEEMERLLKTVNACPLVLHAGITYLNMEDVIDGEGLDSGTTP
ncbi:chaperone NapD [Desulfobulbus sp.]|uniref:chaperone NapD n=1 Tax=Desulfobulbus sp. TaxID=895 RepID=UPI00286EF81D|nr:chaperone NapD [Desulfobulbus sp.]